MDMAGDTSVRKRPVPHNPPLKSDRDQEIERSARKWTVTLLLILAALGTLYWVWPR
jgi:hypothetical protein